MPGFQVMPRQSDQVALPKKVVYTYTWDIQNFVGENVSGSPLIYLKDANLPGYSFETELMKTSVSYEFAKGIKWEDIKVSFYDTSGLGAKLKDMSDKIWTPEDGIRPASEYMADSIIKAYYYDETLAHTWILKNSWVKSVNFSKLTYESSGIQNANVTIAYSWAEFS